MNNDVMNNESHDMDRESHSGAEPERQGTGEHSDHLTVRPGIQAPSSTASGTQRVSKRELSIDEHVEGVLSGDRIVLAKTITLIESLRAEHNRKALEVMERLLPHTGASIRIGITGVPGVGKSSFIEALGTRLTDNGHRIAVLAIDPSSSLSGGSILGDKTRMERLSTDSAAFIRPSPSAGSLGGVARKTREAMLVCEAAGFDVVFIETVGVGQSETMVHSMVDFFLLLMLAGAGDQLQGIKRGIMELADAIVISKADGDNVRASEHARSEYEIALKLLMKPAPDWSPPVLTCSAVTGDGIDEVWQTVQSFRKITTESAWLPRKRREQTLAWMHDTIRQSLHDRFHEDDAVSRLLPELEQRVAAGELPPLVAARRLLHAFFHEDISTL